jgi:hypothetical protein
MNSPNYYATAREHLAVESVGDELLIYDRRSDVAHCLGEVAAAVWSRCEEGASLDELMVAVASVSDDADAERLVLSALAELHEKQLLDGTGAAAAAVSRRDVLKRLAGIGAAATMVPLVISAAVPKPADAAASSTVNCHTSTTTDTSCTVASSSPLVLNGCCSPTQTAPGYYCDSAKHCQTCIAANQTPGTGCTTGNNAFMCCSGTCKTGTGNTDKCA